MDTWLSYAPSPAIWEHGDIVPPLELLPVPGDKASAVRGIVGTGSGEDGDRPCRHREPACVSGLCEGSPCEPLGLMRIETGRFGRAGLSGETEARFTEEHWEGAGPNWYPAA